MSENERASAMRILLVDDESGYVSVLRKRMGRREVEADVALSGGQAIQMLRRNDYDVAVLDLKLGDMDGIEVLRIFKKMAPSMPVIMLTGHGSEKAARDGMRHGAYDYLTKPCELEVLLRKIREAAAMTTAGDGKPGEPSEPRPG